MALNGNLAEDEVALLKLLVVDEESPKILRGALQLYMNPKRKHLTGIWADAIKGVM